MELGALYMYMHVYTCTREQDNSLRRKHLVSVLATRWCLLIGNRFLDQWIDSTSDETHGQAQTDRHRYTKICTHTRTQTDEYRHLQWMTL